MKLIEDTKWTEKDNKDMMDYKKKVKSGELKPIRLEAVGAVLFLRRITNNRKKNNL